MSRTYKDQKQDKVARQLKSAEPLSQRYRNYKQNGHTDEPDDLDGERCPKCGGLTDFQDWYLVCHNCGWVDSADAA